MPHPLVEKHKLQLERVCQLTKAQPLDKTLKLLKSDEAVERFVKEALAWLQKNAPEEEQAVPQARQAEQPAEEPRADLAGELAGVAGAVSTLEGRLHLALNRIAALERQAQDAQMFERVATERLEHLSKLLDELRSGPHLEAPAPAPEVTHAPPEVTHAPPLPTSRRTAKDT